MRIKHAFRLSGGPGGVAKAAGGVFVENGPVRLLTRRLQQAFVTKLRHAGRQVERLHFSRIGEHDDRAQIGGDLGRDSGGERRETGVDEQHMIFGVVDDVGDIVRRQARIDGVADRAYAGNAVIKFEMAVAVHGQRGDAVAEADAQLPQRSHQLSRAQLQRPVVRARDAAVIAARHHFGVAVVAGGVQDDR